MCGSCTTLNTPAFLMYQSRLSLKIPATATTSCSMNLAISRGQASSRVRDSGSGERTSHRVLCHQLGLSATSPKSFLYLIKESPWRGANDSTRGACAPRKRGVTARAPRYEMEFTPTQRFRGHNATRATSKSVHRGIWQSVRRNFHRGAFHFRQKFWRHVQN